MTNVASIQGIGAGTGVVQAAPVPAPSSADTSAVAAKPLAPPPESLGISPRIVVDPSAGAIIQYLSNNGQVQLQIPSTTVVAYLRAGLTPDGLSKPEQPSGGSTFA